MVSLNIPDRPVCIVFNIHSSSAIKEQILRTKIMHITKVLKQENFTDSNGWLQRFKKTFNIKSRLLCAERNNVDINMIKIEVSKINNQNPNDVYNVDERQLLYSMIADKALLIWFGHGKNRLKKGLMNSVI